MKVYVVTKTETNERFDGDFFVILMVASTKEKAIEYINNIIPEKDMEEYEVSKEAKENGIIRRFSGGWSDIEITIDEMEVM